MCYVRVDYTLSCATVRRCKRSARSRVAGREAARTLPEAWWRDMNCKGRPRQSQGPHESGASRRAVFCTFFPYQRTAYRIPYCSVLFLNSDRSRTLLRVV